MSVSVNYDAATRYADAGIPVLPCEPGGKAPHSMLEGPLVCPGGVYHATTNAERIAHWWTEDPNANVGVDVLALDLDDWNALRFLTREQRCDLLRGAWVGTRRGVHVWWCSPEPVKGGRIVRGLSLQGAGTYVLAPPSLHPSGVTYEWLSDGMRWRDLASLPEWARPSRRPALPSARRVPLVDDLRLVGERALSDACARLSARPHGAGTNRRGALYAASCALGEYAAAGALDPERAAVALARVADRLGIEPGDAQRHIRRGLAHGAGIAA